QGNVGTNVPAPQLSIDSQFGLVTATMLAVGTQTTCDLRSKDKVLECFGDNTSCESDLYDDGGCTLNASAATATPDSDVVFHNITAIALGQKHGCLAGDPIPTGSPALFCWG